MTNVRIVCTYDGLPTAQTLERVLAAESYVVEINHGRASLAHVEAARARGEAVILIWSPDAPVSSYMLQWRQSIEPAKLIEIARAQILPEQQHRRWPMIDFSAWSGGRGSAAWRALSDRLRTIHRGAVAPSPGPMRAALALVAASVLAIFGALLVRLHEGGQQVAANPAEGQMALGAQRFDGLGGPLQSVEPASMGDFDVTLGPLAETMSPIPPVASPGLLEAHVAAPVRARSEGLIDRIADMAEPLLRSSSEENPPR